MNLFRPLLFLLLLSGYSSSQAQKGSDFQGLLWRISGNGLERPSYLYGTMHVSDKLAYHLSDSLFQAIEDCDVVALETDPSEWMKGIGGFGHYPSISDQTSDRALLQSSRDRSFYEDAFHLDMPDRERLSKALAQDNRMTDHFLFRTQDRKGNFQENTYLDLFIYRAGRKSGKRVVSLEDLEETMELRNRSMEEGGLMKGMIHYDGEQQNTHELMRDAYREGDLKKLDSVTRLASSDPFLELMVDKRNRIMTRALDSLLQNGEQVVTAVGAAHLPGDTGMIQLLRSKGYELEPLERNFDKKSEKSRSFKKKVEEEYLGSDWQTFHSPDSLFKVEVPGRMYPMVELPHLREFLYPDVTNGVFYQVRSIDTHAPITGKTTEGLKDRVDSLLFEFIPGEILEREEDTLNGHPAFHILNETMQGNLQRYRIVVTPLRILIFKAGGTGELVKGEAGERFFDGLEITRGQEREWKSHQPSMGGFRVDLPAPPLRYEQRTTDMKKEERLKWQSLDPETKDHFLVMKRTLHDHEYIEEDAFELRRLTEKFAESAGLEVESEELGTHDGYPSIDFELSEPNDERKRKGRILIRGGEYYLLLASMKSGQGADPFLNSFAFEESDYRHPFKEYQDTAMEIRTTTIQPEAVPEYSLTEQWRKGYRRWASSEDQEYWFERENKYYGTYTPAEKILVSKVDFKDLTSLKDTTHLWNGTARRLYPQDMVLDEEWNPDGVDSSEFHFLHTDTNSIRCIRSRNLYRKGALFSVRHYGDTLTEPSLFVEKFMKELEPLDSSFGPSVFEDKVDRFFRYAEDGDSAERAKAEQQFGLLRFKEEGVDRLMEFVEENSENEELEELREMAIARFGEHPGHDSIVPFLKGVYRNAVRASEQLAVLQGLARMEDTASRKAVLDLLDHEVPLSSKSEPVERLFQELGDSLELCEPLVPGLFQFTDYEDYKTPIRELVARMADSNIVEGSRYEKAKPFILRDAERSLRKWYAYEKERKAPDTVSFKYDGKEEQYEWWGERHLTDRGKRIGTLASLLAPYHGSDEEVRAFFEELRKVKDPALKLEVSLIRAIHDLEVDKGVWHEIALMDPFRVYLLKRLRGIGKAELYPEALMDQGSVCRGILYHLRDPLEDSAEYIGKRRVEIDGKSGYVHFFRSRSSYRDEWTLDYVGLQPLDPDSVKVEGTFQESSGEILPNEEDAEAAIDELLDGIRVRERERTASNSGSYHGSIW